MTPDDPAYGLPAEDEWPVVGVTGQTETALPEPGDYPAFYRGVADALLNGAPAPVDPNDTVDVIRVLEVAHA
jgi:hypothetical protein